MCKSYRRWYGKQEALEVQNSDSSPCTEWPAIISVYLASQMVSAVGYGDVPPGGIIDCITFLFCIVFGVTALTFCTAQASATLKHFHINRTHYQEEVFAVNRFMREHEISEVCKNILIAIIFSIN